MCRHDTRSRAVALPSVREVRDFRRRRLTEWDLLEVLEDTQLALSELITNAVLHARPPVTASVSCTDQMLEIAVSDGSL